MRSAHLKLRAASLLLTWLVSTREASARKNGIAADGCDGCHHGGQPPTVSLTASPENPATGQAVTLTIGVSQTNGAVAGFYISTLSSKGTFKAIQAGTVVTSGGTGVTHTMPRVGSGGMTAFQVQWSASQPTGVLFMAFALSANNDGTSQGDGGGGASLSITSGCAGTSYYLDQDGDGYGTSDTAFPVQRDCTQPMGYAPVAGDCYDFDRTIHFGAPEICDGKDNNCNGQTDEGLATKVYCQDTDGDGHGVAGEATKTGCAPPSGFGDCNGDCRDNDPAIFPGSPEVCDGLDNNCDGRIDEGARATCGLGWCRRYAVSCISQCTPGPPREETCNAFDDDCDGVADNGTDLQLCGAPGLSCIAGGCVSAANDGGAVDAARTGDSRGAPGGATGEVGGGATIDGSGGGPGGASAPPGASGCAIAGMESTRDGIDLAFAFAMALTAALRQRGRWRWGGRLRPM
jgi:hypothetical protein